MKKIKFNFWLLGFGCGIILTGAVGTFMSLGIKVPDQAVHALESPIEQVAEGKASEEKVEDQGTAPNQTSEITEVETKEEIKEPQELETSEQVPSKVVYYVEVHIPHSSTAKTISKILEEEGVVDDAAAFLEYVSERKKQRYIRSGTVELPQNGDYEEVLDLLINN